jgi:hypothetical protein
MEGKENSERREEIFSKAVKAGKRTYFFDVKSTRNGQYYLTITESKRRFNNELGKFFYEKHKIFLFREDFEKFIDGLDTTIRFIEAESKEMPHEEHQNVTVEAEKETETDDKEKPEEEKTGLADISFEDLGNDVD